MFGYKGKKSKTWNSFILGRLITLLVQFCIQVNHLLMYEIVSHEVPTQGKWILYEHSY